MTITATALIPTIGPAHDRDNPDAWHAFRRGGITATEVRDWRDGSRRREIIDAKVNGTFTDLSHVPAIRHGILREGPIGDWVSQEYGITPTSAAFAHPEHPRYLASPDGITVDFGGQIVTGTEDAVLLEIKTGAHDLTPGPVDADGVLKHVTPGSAFDRAGYMAQMQWQMLVMNATSTLFVWETHTGVIDPETGTYTPDGVPQVVRIRRDQKVIDSLIEVAEDALAQIDAARLAEAGDVLVDDSLPTEHAALVSDYLAAVEEEKAAAGRKAAAWKALQASYLGQPDVKINAGFATLSTTTSVKSKLVFDQDAAREAHPDVFANYDAAVAEFTTATDVETQTLTVRRKK